MRKGAMKQAIKKGKRKMIKEQERKERRNTDDTKVREESKEQSKKRNSNTMITRERITKKKTGE